MQVDPEFDEGHQIHPGLRCAVGTRIGGLHGICRQLADCFFPQCTLDYP